MAQVTIPNPHGLICISLYVCAIAIITILTPSIEDLEAYQAYLCNAVSRDLLLPRL